MPWDIHKFSNITVDDTNLTETKTFRVQAEKNPIIHYKGRTEGTDLGENPQLEVLRSVDGVNYTTLEVITLGIADGGLVPFDAIRDLADDSDGGGSPFLKFRFQHQSALESSETTTTTNFSVAFWVDGDDPNAGVNLIS